jgi:hypothetical protein
MFDDLLSINFMLIVLAFAFVTIIGINILASLARLVLAIIIKAKKL